MTDGKFMWLILATGFGIVLFVCWATGQWDGAEKQVDQTVAKLPESVADHPIPAAVPLLDQTNARKAGDERHQAELKLAEEARQAEIKRQQERH